jgi:hypothetical protein
MHATVRTRLLAAAAAVVMAAWGCNRSTIDRDSTMRGTSGAAADQNAAVTVTGCLQQTSGLTGDYILTEVNRVDRTVGTSGSTTGADVERAQREAAAKSYRLDGNNDQLRDLVGKQVQVSGRVTDQANVGPATTPGSTAAGADRSRDTAPDASRDVHASDLARVKVDSVTKVADSCGAAGPAK